MLITAFYIFNPKVTQEPRNEVGSLSIAKCLVGFELGTFWFLLKGLNPLGHSPTLPNCFLIEEKSNSTETYYKYGKKKSDLKKLIAKRNL